MGIPVLRVWVETPHETEFVGEELSEDLSDLRGEPARRGGVRQITLSVFPVDLLETDVLKKQLETPLWSCLLATNNGSLIWSTCPA